MVTVIGSGPCGAMAAIGLKERGIDCTVISKNERKPCGGILPIKLRERFKFVDKNLDEYRGRKTPLALIESGGTKIEIPSVLVVADREKFDDFLFKMMLDAGVKFVKDSVVGITGGKIVTKKIYNADIIFDASGAYGPVKKNFKLERCYAYRKMISAPEKKIDKMDVQLFINFDLPKAAAGYTWMFFGRDFANVGVHVLDGVLTLEDIEKEISKMIKNNAPFKLGKVEKAGGGIVPKPSTYPLVDGNCVVGGDAAGLVSFLGEGVYYAMLSGWVFSQTFPDVWEYSNRIGSLQKYLKNQLNKTGILIKNKFIRQTAFRLFPSLVGNRIRKAVIKDPYNY